MTETAQVALPDVQAAYDGRGIELEEVGIDRIAYPIAVLEPDGSQQRTVAEAELVVALAADVRGTHMSRFVEVLEEFHDRISAGGVAAMADELRDRLSARTARVGLKFPLFFAREAPVTGEVARMRVDCWIDGRSSEPRTTVRLGVGVPITSLCPCSKEVSDYGAHSQRGRVEITVELKRQGVTVPDLWANELLDVVDSSGSAPIYPLLKRVDERYVTMRAYDKPAFVEDVARDVAIALRSDERITRYDICVANEESIHDHRAVARVRGGTGE